VHPSEFVKCSSENICLVIKSCKFTSILTFTCITDPTKEVARYFTKFYDKENVFPAAFNKLTRMHFTNQNIFTSLLFLFHYCFNNTANLILSIQDPSPISRVMIPEAVIIHFVLLRMSKVLLETC